LEVIYVSSQKIGEASKQLPPYMEKFGAARLSSYIWCTFYTPKKPLPRIIEKILIYLQKE
jgi:hypothetical protein